ncbi:hypothetical protein QYB48_002977 [Clostridium perfringens]|nr:hypothetical protein [Clostridium perfringens]MDK0637100.1 hypothetical protein [Clostridium perfringens]
MNENLFKCLNVLLSESEKIARLDHLGYDILSAFKVKFIGDKPYTIITFNAQVITSPFYYYEFPYDTEVTRCYLIEKDKIPYTLNSTKDECIKETDALNLLKIDNKHKIDIRTIAYILDSNLNVLFDYNKVSCIKVLDKWIRLE